MISPVALLLAMAFWQPYSPTPVCQPPIEYYGPSDPLPNGLQFKYTAGWTHRGRSCDEPIHLATNVQVESVEVQCAIIAHEIGHEQFDLPHSNDPSNIMFRSGTIPGACHVQESSKPVQRPQRRHHHRGDQ